METQIDWFSWLKSLPTKCSECGGKVPWTGVPEGTTEEDYAEFRQVNDLTIVRETLCGNCTGKMMKELDRKIKQRRQE